jgi:hypothetical protein
MLQIFSRIFPSTFPEIRKPGRGFKIYVMNGSLVQWRGGGKKHAAKSMQGLRGVAEIAANIKKESMNLGI